MKSDREIKTVTIPIESNNLKKLKILAIKSDKSMSEFARDLLERALISKVKKDVDIEQAD